METPTPSTSSAAVLLDNMDSRVSPCDDFYKYACGRWPEAHLTESSSSSWFSDRMKYLSSRMESILSDNVTSTDPLPLVHAKSLYASCMDTDKMNELGLEPMTNVLERAGLPMKLPDQSSAAQFSIARTLAKIQRVLSMDLLIQLSMTVDPMTNKTVMLVSPTLGSSSLPELVSTEDRVAVTSQEALGLRLAYMTGVMSALEPNANISDLGTAALKILVVDAQVRSDIQRSESDEAPQVMTYEDLQLMMDNANTTGTSNQKFNWVEYMSVLLEGLGVEVSTNDTVYVDSPEYFVLMAQRLHRNRPETYQRYLWWFLVTSMIPHTTDDLRSLKDELYEALFRRPRQSRATKCVKYVKTFFNMAVSYKYATYDDMKVTSNKVKAMLRDITDSFNRLVASFEWMDFRTKKHAEKKAKAIQSFIGFPEWLLVPGSLEELYQGMEVIDGQFLQSMVRLKATEVKNILKTISQPPSNSSSGWVADPLDVNAFYGRGSNAIAIPAGILQPPFYFLGLESLNYGALGSILGHELTHAFDVQGKDYDEDGQKISWWDDKMTEAYNQRAQCFVDQYGKLGFSDKYFLNGTLTLAENIADNGGLREAYHAYENYLERNGEEPKLPGLENYSHEQLFFLAFANIWCEKTSPEDDINSLADVHSPNKFRVLGTLRNFAAFSRVWGCPEGTGMNPGKKCVLW